jgi:hypothetical protein
MVTKRLTNFAHFRPIFLAVLAVGTSTIGRADVALNIIPTFDSSIALDPNSVNIETTINSAIDYYQNTFTTHTVAPINVTINFREMSTGLGSSNTTLYKIQYSSFLAALNGASSGDSTDATALGTLPNSGTNPVTGTSTINVKTAELRALGFNGALFPPIGAFDGTIGLNTSITTPGSPGSSSQYSLFAVTEHEIDEVLGLGSDLPGGGFFADPAPEDLFRYDSLGNRSYTTNAAARAFFSIDGTTDLAQFDNQGDGGDYGDWQSNPLPGGVQPRVQDAFATPGSNPTLATDVNSPEIVALDAIGYNLSEQSAVPEPSFIWLLLAGSALLAGVAMVRGKMAARAAKS